MDAVHRGDTDANDVGKGYILPASFTGSRRYMSQYFHDSLAICQTIGQPQIFLTMTCNPKWDEITQMMSNFSSYVRPENCPDIVVRVFKSKLDQLLAVIRKENFFGRCIGVLYVIEYQKRGLPHAHMLIWLHPDDKPKTTQEIDKYVSAEIPSHEEDLEGYAAVKKHMIHGPCDIHKLRVVWFN